METPWETTQSTNVQAPIRWTEKWTNVGRVDLLIENNQGLFEQYRTVGSLSKSTFAGMCDENKFMSLKKKKNGCEGGDGDTAPIVSSNHGGELLKLQLHLLEQWIGK